MIAPGEDLAWEFDLSFVFPDIRAGDELCFKVWSRPLDAAVHSQRHVCTLLE